MEANVKIELWWWGVIVNRKQECSIFFFFKEFFWNDTSRFLISSSLLFFSSRDEGLCARGPCDWRVVTDALTGNPLWSHSKYDKLVFLEYLGWLFLLLFFESRDFLLQVLSDSKWIQEFLWPVEGPALVGGVLWLSVALGWNCCPHAVLCEGWGVEWSIRWGLSVQPGLVCPSRAEAPGKDRFWCAWGRIEWMKKNLPYSGRFDQTCLYSAL